MSLKLTDLFSLPDVAAAVNAFPKGVQPGPGLDATLPNQDLLPWLTFLNSAVKVEDVRAGSDADGVSVEAKLHGTMIAGGFPRRVSICPDDDARCAVPHPGHAIQQPPRGCSFASAIRAPMW